MSAAIAAEVIDHLIDNGYVANEKKAIRSFEEMSPE